MIHDSSWLNHESWIYYKLYNLKQTFYGHNIFVTKSTQSRGLFICIYYLASRKWHFCVTCSITGSIVYFVFIYLFTYCVLFVLDSEILILRQVIRELICIYTSCATIPGRFTSLHYVCNLKNAFESYAFVCKNGNVWNK